MDLTTLWLAQERTIEARQRAAEDRQARTARRSTGDRTLLQRIRGKR
jgi:hypothetical protein